MIRVLRTARLEDVEGAIHQLAPVPAWQRELTARNGLGLYILDVDTRASYVGLAGRGEKTGDGRSYDTDDMAWFDPMVNAIVIYRKALHAKRIFQVMLHEYAHALDWALGGGDWFTYSPAFHPFWENGRPLDRYAATDPVEFFAQAYEAFHRDERVPCRAYYEHTRHDLAQEDPELYQLLQRFQETPPGWR